MVYIVFAKENVISFVAKELQAVLDYMTSHRYYKVEIWNGPKHSGGSYR